MEMNAVKIDVSKPGVLEVIRRCDFSFERLAEEYTPLSVLKNVPQNPEYHGEGDVFVHTAMVCEQVLALEEWSTLSDKEQELLFLAAAFHDIGKPPCTKLENGAWTSPKHTIVGEKEFRRLVYRDGRHFGLTFEQRELVAKLIRYHGLPVWFLKKRRPEYELYKAAESVPMKLLYLLSKADTRGRIGSDAWKLSENVELFGQQVMELGLWEKPAVFANAYSKYQYFRKSDMWQGASLYDDTEFEVILMSGLPLSGKDTWIKNHGRTREIISLDDIREELGISPADGSAKVADVATRRARELLRRKEPFIWNATNIIQETRQKLISLCADYGARVKVVYLEVPYEELMQRNQKRERKIPEKVLEEMIRKMEVPAPWEAYDVEYWVR